MSAARCVDCDREYSSTGASDAGLCPGCQALEDAIYAVGEIPESEPRPMSKAWMRERLGVSGDVDE